jgi:uncharacterized protein YciI
MSDTERKLMEEHVRYWRALQERGIVLVYGPVFDVRGDWGMGIMETEDLARAQEFAANDPAIRAGLHTIEVSPMKAVLPDQWAGIRATIRGGGAI